MPRYNPKILEKKWQKIWDAKKSFAAQDFSKKPKYYTLVEFPYPSGDGLHVGHVRSYSALDAIARWRRMSGYNVLYPIGFDAFGLPTENFAIKNKIHPRLATDRNIKTFTRQLKSLGLSFDWSRAVDTTDPEYYKWTQWIFLKLYKSGLAYRDEIPINWCPKCKTGLANEEVVNGRHERCGTLVEKKILKQWVIKITQYADRLLSDLALVDYPERVKIQQINWIGRKEGINIRYKIEGTDKEVVTFTTRPDTNFGATFVVIAPENPLASEIPVADRRSEVEKYVKTAQKKTEEGRIVEGRKKTGVFTGRYALNNLNGSKMPIWVSDFVLGNVGTGAVVGVPGHDMRDFEFAREFGQEIIRVVVGKDGDTSPITRLSQVQEEEGKMVNSGFLNGLDIHEATQKIMDHIEKQGWGTRTITYHLRDWIFSRQHYWGEPIPIVYCDQCGEVPVPEKDLPLVLPNVKKYEPTDTGESPLASIKSFINTQCPKCGGKATRETDTMPNWAGSNWYFIRYLDPKNSKEFTSRKKIDYWMPVDLYNGGMEHTTLHLLYSRFIYKFLFDQGLVPGPEPYAKRTSHGMVLASDGRKMSKSFGNVINPDEIVGEYGADTLRMYEMFLAPFEQMVPWDNRGVIGVKRFLDRVWNLYHTFTFPPQSMGREKGRGLKRSGNNLFSSSSPSPGEEGKDSQESIHLIHKLIKKVTSDLQEMKFNTAVAAFMESLNNLESLPSITKEAAESYLKLLAPFAPHIAEELWQYLGYKDSVHQQPWPKWDESMVADEIIKIPVSINGKTRDVIEVPANTEQHEIENQALNSPKVAAYLLGKTIIRTVYVAGKMVNFVVK